jgi:hypothetical protein
VKPPQSSGLLRPIHSVALFSIAILGCQSDRAPAEGGSSTPTPPLVLTVPAQIATEFASGGTFAEAEDGEALTGFPLLRPEETTFPLDRHAGLVETFPEVGLPRARQVLVVPGKRSTLEWTQEPATYRTAKPPRSVTRVTFGSFEGELWERDESICFVFATGATIQDIPIRGSVCSFDDEYSVEDIGRFVSSLSFGDETSIDGGSL